jgi:cytochrome c oxidase assembly protein subunit 15
MKIRLAVRVLFFYTLLVILWGAWVRISHSGAGCGESWPLCQGQFIPGMGGENLTVTHGKTWVEYTHRLMSGLYGIFVFGVWLVVWRGFPSRSNPRKMASLVLFFTITEALLGAKLVLLGLVADNVSWFRTFSMSLHQVNSLLLTGSVTALWLSLLPGHFRWRPRNLLVALIFCLIAVTGAWAALASTLFPSESLWEGIMKDFSPGSHHVLRLRVLHPLMALLGAGGLAVFLWMKSFDRGPDRRLHLETSLALMSALFFGMATLLFLSPVWMKLAHLALAHLLWAVMVRWGFSGQEA